MDSIFRLADDGVGLMVLELVPFLGGQPNRWKRVAVADLALRFRDAWRFGRGNVAAELLALLAVIASEPKQRELVARKCNKRLRYIKLGGQPVSWHLREIMNRQAPHNRKEGERKMLDEDFDIIVARAMAMARTELKFPGKNPAESSYPVSDAVVSTAKNPALRQYLQTLAVDGSILFGQLRVVCDKIHKIGPEPEAKGVIDLLLEGYTREHLSAMSMSSKGRYTWVTVVNPKGIILKMPARKFEALIGDAGQTKLIGEIDTRDIDSGLPEVEVNAPVDVKVVTGHYEAATSTLHVACLSEKNLEVAFSTSFVLDADSAVCLYLTLRRLRLDRQRFEHLMDAAETKLPVDPFRHLQDRRSDP